MYFKEKKLNDTISFVYGFKKSTRIYGTVLTLEKNDNEDKSVIHALLSRENLTPGNFINMWDFLKSITGNNFFEFEVLPEHGRVYIRFFKSVKVEHAHTFDGHESEILTIHRECEMLFRIT